MFILPNLSSCILWDFHLAFCILAVKQEIKLVLLFIKCEGSKCDLPIDNLYVIIHEKCEALLLNLGLTGLTVLLITHPFNYHRLSLTSLSVRTNLQV